MQATYVQAKVKTDAPAAPLPIKKTCAPLEATLTTHIQHPLQPTPPRHFLFFFFFFDDDNDLGTAACCCGALVLLTPACLAAAAAPAASVADSGLTAACEGGARK